MQTCKMKEYLKPSTRPVIASYLCEAISSLHSKGNCFVGKITLLAKTESPFLN